MATVKQIALQLERANIKAEKLKKELAETQESKKQLTIDLKEAKAAETQKTGVEKPTANKTAAKKAPAKKTTTEKKSTEKK